MIIAVQRPAGVGNSQCAFAVAIQSDQQLHNVSRLCWRRLRRCQTQRGMVDNHLLWIL